MTGFEARGELELTYTRLHSREKPHNTPRRIPPFLHSSHYKIRTANPISTSEDVLVRSLIRIHRIRRIDA